MKDKEISGKTHCFAIALDIKCPAKEIIFARYFYTKHVQQEPEMSGEEPQKVFGSLILHHLIGSLLIFCTDFAIRTTLKSGLSDPLC